MKLDDDAKQRLETVLSIADCASLIRNAVTEALHGVVDQARRVYLRGVLTRAAAHKLREINKKKAAAARKKTQQRKTAQKVVTSPAMYLDAYRHELAMGAPQDD